MAAEEKTPPATTRRRPRGKKPIVEERAKKTATPSKASDVSLKGMLGAYPRQTLPSNANILGALQWGYLPRRQYAASVDLATLPDAALSPQQLMELLADASPEVGQATWNITRLAGAEWSYEVRLPNNTKADPAGKALLDDLLARVNPLAGGFEGLLSQWVQSAVLEGAVAGECIPSDDFTGVADLVPVQPWTIFFRRDVRQQLVALQWQPMLASGAVPDTLTAPPQNAASLLANPNTYDRFDGFRVLNTVTFGYVGLDPFIDDPYGRLPFGSIVQVLAFDAQLLKDLRQWSHTHAWGRLDVSVLAERVEKAIPPRILSNPVERLQFRENYLNGIKTAYAALNPDDTFIHYDDVTVSGVAEQQGQTFAIDGLIRIVERRMFRALRQLPILMGSNEGTTETWGTLQMEVYALGVQSMQKVVASLCEHLLNAALQLLGSTSVVEFTFEKIRSTDRIKDASAEKLEIMNEATKRDEGWQTQNEASIAITGSEAVAPPPSPDNPYLPGQPDAATPTAPVADANAPAPADAPQDAKDTETKDGKPADDTGRLYADVLARLLLSVRAERKAYRLSDARKAAASDLHTKVAGYFRDASVPQATVQHIYDLHAGDRAEAVAGARATPPLVAAAVRTIYENTRTRSLRPLTLYYQRLSDDERASLIASIAAMLRDAFPDDDTTLATILIEARTAAWDSAGIEALRQLGFSDAASAGFHLSNSALIKQIEQVAREHVSGIAQTTRQRLAGVIADSLESGRTVTQIASDLRAALDTMANGAEGSVSAGRADDIANYETSDAWNSATIETGQRNGGTTKSWVTAGDDHVDASCMDNEAAGDIPLDGDFPSGAAYPPEHDRCRCYSELTQLDSPDEASIWLGE